MHPNPEPLLPNMLREGLTTDYALFVVPKEPAP
jgi:hypothetical protein